LKRTQFLNFQASSNYTVTHNFIAVEDMDRDSKDEIVVCTSLFENGADITFHLWVYSADSLLSNLTLKAQRQYDEPVPNTGGQSDRHYAITLGDFDGDRIRLGPPRRYQVSQMIQPMVILNAPPIHFDVFNDTTFDVCRSYNGNPPLFYSRFRKLNTTTVEMTSEVSHAWGVGLAFQESSAVFGLGIKKTLTATYGEQYKNISGTSQTVTVQVQVDAREDDRIYATVCDYDIYEYPYYVSDTLMGYIVSLLPLLSEHRWFPSKSWSAATYQPDHEVSNIFSYKRYPTLQTNPAIAQFIKGSYGTSFVLDNSSSYDWSLLYQDFVTGGASTTRKANVALSFEAEVWGIKVGVSGTYDYNATYTHTTSVTNQLELSFHLDAINMTIGETRYTVTPYAYWSKNGALVLDFAARPEVAFPGFPRTWWQTRYGDLPDPAFILPWRLDPEKGFPVQENAKRFQAKDIAFSRDSPAVGDTITISTRVQNYSLVNTPFPVPVIFSLGDPDSGGTQLLDVNGAGTFFTRTALGSREIDTVSMRWRVPSGLPQYPRIYAKLNPANAFAEIHRNNNKAFNVLGGIPFSTGVGDGGKGNGQVPEEFVLYPAYPNPFNPSTKIGFRIQGSEFTTLKVYDLLGREVRTLVNERLQPGSYETILDASGLASGVYFYQLRSGEATRTSKLLLLR
ncbi:MAG: T9SS type A sorting domain-containing protein, partial [Bacteroidota bacterium]